MAISLRKQFWAAQQNNQEALQDIIIQFNPLLQKYASQLDYEDGRNDLVVFMINFIKHINLHRFEADAQLTAYLEVSVRHEFYRLAKKHQKLIQSEQLTENKDIEKLQQSFTIDTECDFVIDVCRSDRFTQKERNVLYLHYVLDYSIAEIATAYRISRQAVNQLKNRAIKKMQNEL